MKNRIVQILDECLDRIRSGESIDSCLAEYSDLRDELEPLLNTALKIFPDQEIAPSDEFIRALENRLLIRHDEQQVTPIEVQTGIRSGLLITASVYWNKTITLIGKRSFVFRTALAVLLVVAMCFVVSDFLFQAPASASACTLSILSGSTDIKEFGSDDWEPASDGMELTVGSRAKTSPQSYSILTFANGCTVKLQPETDIQIKQLEFYGEITNIIVLKQSSGITWSHIASNRDSSVYYEIETPSVRAVASGTSFTTEVSDTGLTRVVTAEGTVRVSVNGEEVDLPAGVQVEVQARGNSSQLSAIPAPDSYISVTVDEPAVVSVIDSTGSSIGLLPGGLSFSQIPGAVYSMMNNHTGMVTIPNPVDGIYTIALRYNAKGQAPVNIQGITEGYVAFEYSGNYEGTKKSGWLIECDIDVENGSIAGGEVTNIELLGEEIPEKAIKVKPNDDKDKSRSNEDNKEENRDNDSNVKDKEDNGNKDNGQGNLDKEKKDKKE